MVKIIIKKLIDISANIISLPINYNFLFITQFIINRIFSFSAARKFGSVGKNFSLDKKTIIHDPENITIGDNFIALSGFRIDTFSIYNKIQYSPKIIIGNNVTFNCDCHIGCCNFIQIGNNVLVASRVFITDHSHGNNTIEDMEVIPVKRPLYSKGPVIIKDNVWIGEGVAILAGVTIGENAIIGANAVVNKDIPDNAIAAGNPARVIRIIK